MSSVLKRKRGPVEVVEPSKKAKSTSKYKISAPVLDSFKVGWDAAFPTKRHADLAPTNGVNGVSALTRSASPDAEDYEDLVEKHENAKAEKKKREAKAPQYDVPTWKISEPIGGRMIDVDPVFTDDER
jgi:NET1-associated nuclear protein 1 (U3 small nucleolar RNA-associated protein 17)